MTVTIDQLKAQYGGTRGEHPDHKVDDWVYEAQNGDTGLGYWEWVAARLAEEA